MPNGAVPSARVVRNLRCIEILHDLEQQQRGPTPAELSDLAGWSSWGAQGVSVLFDADLDDKIHRYGALFQQYRHRLEALLTPTEYDAARRTVLNAHYTAPRYVQPMWDLVTALGFPGGRVLEPGCGAGNFLSAAPDGCDLVGVELDPITAKIAGHLNPAATILTGSFAETRHHRDSFDLVIGNVPFGRYKLHDPQYNPDRQHSIHNHFILKSLHLTAPGGLVAVITSRYTLDSRNPAARHAIAELADLVGAVRLPTGAHRDAAGTEAVTDLLILRRRDPATGPGDSTGWNRSMPVEVPGRDGPTTVTVNEWFLDRPDMVLGELTAAHGLYGADDLVVTFPRNPDPDHDLKLSDRVATSLVDALRSIRDDARSAGLVWNVHHDRDRPVAIDAPIAQAGDINGFEGHIADDRNGGFTVVLDGVPQPLPVPATQHRELRRLLTLRDSAVTLLQAEAASLEDSETLDGLRQQLNQTYDDYLAHHGPINRFSETVTSRTDPETGEPVVQRRTPPVMRIFRTDPHAPLTMALEQFDDASQTAFKADILKRRVVTQRQPRRGADTAEEAVAICLDTHGEIRLDAIADLLGVDQADVATHLAGHIFLDPDTQRWVPAAEYLSGNVRAKLDTATHAAAEQPGLDGNVRALQAALPADLGPGDIAVRLGAVWVPATDVEDFLRDLFRQHSLQVEHAGGSQWSVRGYAGSTLTSSTWGTDRMDGIRIAQSLLTQSPVLVYDTVEDQYGSERRILNPTETYAAQDKAEQLNERFVDWLWSDPDRSLRLCRTYNRLYNSIVLREYDGGHLTLPGLAATWEPKSHQRAAVARMMAEPAVGLFHEVGAGKTAEMVMGCMELRRLGLAAKPAVVVPNHMLEQFSREWLQLYPQAKILAASTQDLAGDKRRRFVARAATGDWDGIILTRGSFARLDVTADTLKDYRDAELALLRDRLEKSQQGSGLGAKRIERQIASVEEKLKAQLDQPRDPGLSFEETGIDYLCIDELHDYKNLSTGSNIPGAAIAGSARALDLHLKLHYLRGRHGDRVVTGATATPIANSMTEAYVMQRYLRPDLLLDAGLQDFDSWAATFGTVETGLEIGPTGRPRMKSRFAKFVNVPELLRMWHVSGDIKTAEDLDLPVPDMAAGPDGERGPSIVTVPASDYLADYMELLNERADAVKNGAVEPSEDNMLVITSDGRKAALDLRLLSAEQHDLMAERTDAVVDRLDTKAATAADRIAQIYRATADRTYQTADGEPHPRPGALQLVFCDLGTPAAKPASTGTPGGPTRPFTVYDELKTRLVADGVPVDKVRFIHEAGNDAEKARLFQACRDGQVAVLIGSTQKMGVGTNIQDRAVALHHLDCPWRPADIAQRDGRIRRRGNQNREIEIIRYVTEHSFDAVLWGIIARKAKFIGQVMKGRLDVREIDDIGDVALDAAQVAAVVTGDDRLLVKAQLDADVQKYERLERAHQRNQAMLVQSAHDLTARQTEYRGLLAVATDLAARHQDTSGDKFQCIVGNPTSDRPVIRSRVDAQHDLLRQLRILQSPSGRGTTPSAGAEPPVVITMGQVPFVAVPQLTQEGRCFDLFVQGLQARDDRVRVSPGHLQGHDDAGGHGLITRLENRAAQLPEIIDSLKRSITRAEQEAEQTQKGIGLPYKHADLLAEKRGELHQLLRTLATEAADAERGPDSAEDRYPVVDTAALARQDRPVTVHDAALHDAAALALASIEGDTTRPRVRGSRRAQQPPQGRDLDW